MPSVEYHQTDLVVGIETREYTDPDTGETVTGEVEVEKNPFEVRISKWLERSDGYHLHGFVKATEFGKSLASKSNPWQWLTNNYTVADGISESDVSDMVDGVGGVQAAQLSEILAFGNVSPVDATVTDEQADRFDFEVVLSDATTFDIDWLTVKFNPEQSLGGL